MKVFDELEEEDEELSIEQPTQSKGAKVVKIVGLSFALGVLTSCFGLGVAQLFYSGNAVSAAKEDFKNVAMQEAQEISEFKLGKNENNQDVLYVDVVAEDNSSYQMQWNVDGYQLNLNKPLAAKDVTKLIKSEDPRITKYDSQEM